MIFESGKGPHDAGPQLRSLRLEHAHHRRNALVTVRGKTRTDFSATFLGELAISMPMRPISLFEPESSLAMPTSCMKLAVASLLRSCMTKVSLAGIFARRFLAMGYPEEGTQPFVSNVPRSIRGRLVEEMVGLPRVLTRRKAYPFSQGL